jgi:uncharacterized protein (DUF1330 family)
VPEVLARRGHLLFPGIAGSHYTRDMPAYVIANVTVEDPERYPDYVRQVPATLEPYGGRFLVRGGAVEVPEGEWRPNRLVIIEFPSLEQARAWYDSPEYGPARQLRWATSEAEVVFVEGVPPA